MMDMAETYWRMQDAAKAHVEARGFRAWRNFDNGRLGVFRPDRAAPGDLAGVAYVMISDDDIREGDDGAAIAAAERAMALYDREEAFAAA